MRFYTTRLLSSLFRNTLLLGAACSFLIPLAAAPNRITRAVDARNMRAIPGHLHRLAQPQYDRGLASPDLAMKYMVMLFEPAAAQRSELTQLIADQQNPASSSYHRWLTPENFAERFGLSPNDLTKVSAWLKSQGFVIEHQSRAANWVAFSGTAAQTLAGHRRMS